MKILFACGGTAGHINPAIAVANYIKAREPNTEILFAGNPHGMEARLVPQSGYNFAPIEVQGLQRKLSVQNIQRNIKSGWLLMTCWGKARTIIKDFAPDVVVGTGGYVSGPILRKAHQMGIKTLTHESNAFPGLTTKLVAKTADRVLLAVKEAQKYLPEGPEYVVTGTPIREEILTANRQAARNKLGVGDRVCILSFGGSLGAQRVNECVSDVVGWHAGSGKVHHIHATGSYGVELFPKLLREKGVSFQGDVHIDIREYINNMADCLAAADLVICRAGATTLSELEAAGRASILIPSPNVAENHQYHNAMVLQNKGAALVIEERDLTGPILTHAVEQLVENPQQLAELGRNAKSLALTDANRRIYEEILAVIGQKRP